MRHFKSVQFPTSGSHAQSSFVLNLFPIDVVLAILEHCSPFDLVELRRTSRLFRAIIASHQQLWVSSQRNLAIGTSLKVPSLPAIEASGNFSQWAYASWLFGGGPCTSCSKWTDRLPCNFVLRFRACSPSCQSILMFEPVLYVDRTRKHDNFSWGNWLPRIGRELSNGDTIHIYSSRAIKTAELERQQAIRIDRGTPPDDSMPFPCRTGVQLDEEYNRRARSRPELIKNAEALKDWQKLYMQQHDLVSQSNSEFLKLRSVEENRKFQGVMRCPTVSRLFFAFNRDLVTITHTSQGSLGRYTCALIIISLSLGPKPDARARRAQVPATRRLSRRDDPAAQRQSALPDLLAARQSRRPRRTQLG
ncbi:hypothetical protein B0H15DRAFT_851995 [Mycena belliarum]|uniref:F-box domain-containing protein n=1 Tax=Mycena belliarum TaxID=1033014 RepID=A0AAD6XJG8_9AGAR|nr:hypothetical protein B0H15DRAFT_851995 [Mycena belliae]